MPTVEIPGVGNIDFPEGTPTAQMESSIKRYLVERQGKPTTPEAQLTEGNRPLSAGYEAARNAVTGGLGKMADLSAPSGLVLGPLEVLNAPSEGAGRAAGTAVQNVLADIPGLGGAAGIIPAGGAALADAATQVLTGTGLMKGVVAGAKGATKAVGRMFTPAATRTAGTAAAMEQAGATANPITRAYEVPGSKTAYQIAEAQPPISAQSVADTLRQSEAGASKSMLARPARRIIKQTAENVYPSLKPQEVPGASNLAKYLEGKQKVADDLLKQAQQRPSEITWRNAIDEAQGLREQAHTAFRAGKNHTGNTLRAAADNLVGKLEKVNPEYAVANKLYLREHGINKIAEIMGKAQPSSKLGVLFNKDPLTRAAFDPSEAAMFNKIAQYLDTIGASASPYSGMGGRVMDALGTPVAGMLRNKTGMAILKQSFKNTKASTPAALNSAIQLWNAAQRHGETGE